jgi:predicted Zn-dependent protease
VSSPFGFSKELGVFKSAANSVRRGMKVGRHIAADRARRQVEQEYGTETAEAVAAAVVAGRSPRAILENTKRRKAERARTFVRWLISKIGELAILRLSRKREFWADATAAALLGPEPMIEALRRLNGDPIEPPASKLAYARLMIRSHPKEWFSTHPSIESRIEAIAKGTFTERLPYRQIQTQLE